jgi:3-oxoacyl-(acyl-carrier-protein) synthase
MREPEVVIAGCGAITAVGRGVDALRSALHANTSGLRADERFNHPRFQSQIVGAVPRDGSNDDPAHELATAALREACDQARDVLAKVPAKRIGFVFATTKANIEALERVSDGRACSDAARRHLQADLLAADLAAENGACGPVQCISVACVSGSIALQQGAKLIQRGVADAVLVAGVDHLSAFVVSGFTVLKAIDPGGCRPFDRDRCGLSPGEAGAAIVLTRADFAPVGSIAITGWGASNDANHMTGPSRDGAGLAQAIRAALSTAALRPEEIDYANAHGTGTPYNDAMESAALQNVFGAACPPVSGQKGMLGHTLGAAGIVETIACVLALREKFLPGTPGLGTAAEGFPATIVKSPRPATQLRHVLKLNTGFGGVNSALILSHG